jgi:hypothetical protein
MGQGPVPGPGPSPMPGQAPLGQGQQPILNVSLLYFHYASLLDSYAMYWNTMSQFADFTFYRTL